MTARRGHPNPDWGRPWTAAEDAAMREGYVRRGARALQTTLGDRSIHAIRKRAARLGVTAKRPWTAKEGARLTEMWGLHTTRGIARRLGRSAKAVYARAAVRGLVARERTGTEKLADAAKRCGYDKRDLRRILRRAGVLRESVSRNSTGQGLRPSYQLDPFEVDEAVAEYVRGSSMLAAARARGITDGRLRRALEKIGVTRPSGLKVGEQWRISDELADRALGRAA